jgi:hypothetical protein
MVDTMGTVVRLYMRAIFVAICRKIIVPLAFALGLIEDAE